MPVHKAKEGQDRPGQRETSRLHEVSVDYTDRDGTENQSPQDRPSSKDFKPPIKDALVLHFCGELLGNGECSRGGEDSVHKGDRPVREVRSESENYRRSVPLWGFLNAWEPISIPM